MALEFLSNAAVGDAELVIRLDLDGLQTLLKTLETAAAARLERPAGEDDTADGEAWTAFDKVTVSFLPPTQPAAQPN